jgi:hypothetical protein
VLLAHAVHRLLLVLLAHAVHRLLLVLLAHRLTACLECLTASPLHRSKCSGFSTSPPWHVPPSWQVYMAEVIRDSSFKLQLTAIVSWKDTEAMQEASLLSDSTSTAGGGISGISGVGGGTALPGGMPQCLVSHHSHVELKRMLHHYAPHMTLAAGAVTGE